jgi:ATP-binding cassette subfamily F protein 3
MITVKNVSKHFGAQVLFEDISLQINERDRFALVGPNGAGKSTLFKLIMGQEEPDKGEISLRTGVRFGYLPQETANLSGNPVLTEVLGEEADDNRREAQAKKILMGLGFKIKDFDRPVSEFSGGWQMRVMIAKLLFE